MTKATATIIIPAHNEAGYIAECLAHVLAQDAGGLQVIVAANACTDDTVAIARALEADFAARGYALAVLDLPKPGKISALNSAETQAGAGPRIYLDADVRCDPTLVGQLEAALDTDAPRYATGRLVVSRAQTALTRAYARLWQELPFVKAGAVGAGLFAVNAAGRARWGAFPDIISDDTFVRLNFTPAERIEVHACYHWPMIEGFAGLVKVRRRQDAGVRQVRRLYPDLMVNDTTPGLGLAGAARLALRHPVSFAVYLAVHLAVRTKRSSDEWTRGR
ncbi:hypothetical protein ROLI_045540 (plasmid) [Roseobacter fucihabitans]|uniref:Glycosyltransferase 2-like domain-containing protein n=1 Tax=Roseobacter fucihabitans TaxID=1537242 RepID=A0ABZ2C032_9RHOB|nr:glycosyltransferase [Roseobacter litoralis]MBC6967866.1 N-glycosyltransferase [Roseobacter litoralis]